MSWRARPLALLALCVAACGSGQAASVPSATPTVGDVGDLPGGTPAGTTVDRPPSDPAEEDDPTVPASTEEGAPDESTSRQPTTTSRRSSRPTTSVAGRADPDTSPVGGLVDGNRVIVIGDSIVAATARRYGDDMCDRLVPQGWAVEVDAETGQRIEFARTVLRQRLSAGWDAAVIMLGNNYDGDPQAYADVLDDVLDDLAPRPVVLVSVTEFRPDRAEVNYVLRATAADRDNVRVLEWSERTRDAPELLGDDGLHLSDAGRIALAQLISRALGRAPAGSVGACLPTRFTNDSAGAPDGE